MSFDETQLTIDAELNATGLYCPEPVMMLHNKIRDMQAGQVLKLIATDPSTTRDVTKFCIFLGHELLHDEVRDNTFYYFIKKSTA